eukprot:COSAG05_NODE_8047_length_742_cov_0.844479_2_plen_42_part_01
MVLEAQAGVVAVPGLHAQYVGCGVDNNSVSGEWGAGSGGSSN